MSILILFNNKDPKPWLHALKKEIPNTDINIYPNLKDVASVKFVVCWKPEKNILNQFPNLEIIQSVGASVDHIIQTHDLKKDVVLSRIIDPNLSHDMWEFLLTVTLSQLKNTLLYNRQQISKDWYPHEYKNIKTSTVAILGLGKIGSYVSRKFAEQGFHVKGWSASKKNIPNVQSFVGSGEIIPFLTGSDILINLLPLTEDTKDILNYENLKKLNPNAFLINVGRGEHLIEKDLINLLDSSFLSGALLDVFRVEPLPENHPFWTHPKIQITPHVASLTDVNSASKQIAENYHKFIAKQQLFNTVSIKKGY